MASSEDIAKAMQEELDRLRRKDEEQQKTIQALQDEFAEAHDPESISRVARNAIVDLMPRAIAQMGILIEHAESESVRAGLSRFVVSCGLDKSKFEDADTASLKSLIAQLAENDPTP